MAADDRPILAAGEDRLDEAELAHASFERVELVVVDPARVGRVGPELVEWDVLDGKGGRRRGNRTGRSLRHRPGSARWPCIRAPAE